MVTKHLIVLTCYLSKGTKIKTVVFWVFFSPLLILQTLLWWTLLWLPFVAKVLCSPISKVWELPEWA